MTALKNSLGPVITVAASTYEKIRPMGPADSADYVYDNQSDIETKIDAQLRPLEDSDLLVPSILQYIRQLLHNLPVRGRSFPEQKQYNRTFYTIARQMDVIAQYLQYTRVDDTENEVVPIEFAAGTARDIGDEKNPGTAMKLVKKFANDRLRISASDVNDAKLAWSLKKIGSVLHLADIPGDPKIKRPRQSNVGMYSALRIDHANLPPAPATEILGGVIIPVDPHFEEIREQKVRLVAWTPQTLDRSITIAMIKRLLEDPDHDYFTVDPLNKNIPTN